MTKIPEYAEMSAAERSYKYGIQFTPGKPDMALAHAMKDASTEGAALPNMAFNAPQIPRETPQDYMLYSPKKGPLEATGTNPVETKVVVAPPPILTTAIGRHVDTKA